MITRIITGIIGIALAAYVIQTGGWVFSGMVLLLSVAGWHEFVKAFIHKGIRLSYFIGILVLVLFWGCAWLGNSDEFVAVGTAAMLVVLSKAVLAHKTFSVEQACISLAGMVYVGFAFSHLILLRFMGNGVMLQTPVGNMEAGCALLWLALIGTWASDTFAYFTGSLLGRHKLCPDISPNKTIEGFIGGLIGTTVSVVVLGMAVSFPFLSMLLLGICVDLIATIGDLVESIIKRYTGIKDSGSLIPGHGGVLDRFDSVMFTVPFVYYFMQISKIAG